MSPTTGKRERECTVSTLGSDSEIATTVRDCKRPCLSRVSPPLSSNIFSAVQRPLLMTGGQGLQAHPITTLDAIRTKLQSTSDSHLQARLLLQYSSTAASPGCRTAAAIDFLFSFLQQHQTQSEAPNERKQASKSGAIVVGATVRGLRQLLAVKSAVVEPMIQVDAMAEQLMQCMSVGEDFKLRRDMMCIVVDCLLLTRKYKQVEALLHTCVQDHDSGLQVICLRGYLRLLDAGQRFCAVEPHLATKMSDVVVEHFDRLLGFVLFGQSDEVKVLAAQVMVTLADLYPQHDVASSKAFPSFPAIVKTKMPSSLPEKVFYVLCLAGNDSSDTVRSEVARCLRRFERVLASEIVEHAVMKSQITESVEDAAPEDVEKDTRHMMSSGVLLSLLEDVDANVAAEASRSIARLGEMATTPNAGAGQWSLRAIERAITAHFDVLPRAKVPSAVQLRHVLVNSLSRLLACRQSLGTATDFTISSTEMSCLVRSAISGADSVNAVVVEALLIFRGCDLSSVWAVRCLVNFILELGALPLIDHSFSNCGNDVGTANCSDERLLDVVQVLGKKCAKVFRTDVILSDSVRDAASTLLGSKRRLLGRMCRALLGHAEHPNDEASRLTDEPEPAFVGSSLLFRHRQSSETVHVTSRSSSIISAQAFCAMKSLQVPPTDENVAVYLGVIQRLRTAVAVNDLDAAFGITHVLVRLREHVRSFPDVSAAPVLATNKYVSMEAMLSTSPCVSSDRTNGSNGGIQDQTEAQAFGHLSLSMELQRGCQEIIDAASEVYVKAFALCTVLRTELLQLIMLGRIGLVLASLQSSGDSVFISGTLRWIAKEAARLRFLVHDNQVHDSVWLPIESLSEVSSVNDLKRTFVDIARKAWPVALINAAMSRCSFPLDGFGGCSQRLCIVDASILEPSTCASAKTEPREITANWPFQQRVRFLLTNVRDVTQVFIKSMLPNGDVEHHYVPANCIHNHGRRKYLVEHTIRLTVSPFSDPTAFVVAVCIGHPTLPGCVEQNTSGSSEASPQMFTDISVSVRVPIFHRTSLLSRQSAAKASTAP